MAKLTSAKVAPTSLNWCPTENNLVTFISGRGPLYMWNYSAGTTITVQRDAQSFMSDVCQFRWHPKKAGKLAFGHSEGSISLFNPGERD